MYEFVHVFVVQINLTNVQYIFNYLHPIVERIVFQSVKFHMVLCCRLYFHFQKCQYDLQLWKHPFYFFSGKKIHIFLKRELLQKMLQVAKERKIFHLVPSQEEPSRTRAVTTTRKYFLARMRRCAHGTDRAPRTDRAVTLPSIGDFHTCSIFLLRTKSGISYFSLQFTQNIIYYHHYFIILQLS